MEIFFGWIVTSDINLFKFINRQLKSKSLDFIMPRITHLGGAVFTISSLMALLIFFKGEVRFLAIQALASLTLSHIIVQIIKRISGRKRPYMVIPEAQIFANPLIDYSFPSGHTTSSFAIAVTFSLHSWLFALILLPLASLVGISRIYLGLHYPTDCIIGALLGTASSIFIVFAYSYYFM